MIGTSAFAVGLPAPKQAAGNYAGLTAASRGALRGVAPYYLALVSFGKPVDSGSRMEGQIRATATGKIIAVVRPPRPFGTLSVITGAADDRTFVLAAQKTPYPPNQPVKYFLARFHPASGQVTVRPLAIPETPARDDLMGIDLSPDGADLAVAVTTGNPIRDAKVSIYSLRTGRVAAWRQAPGATCTENDDPGCMSWSGRTLAFNWAGAADQQGVWLLNTATRGGGLLASSRLAVSAGPSPFRGWHWNGDGLLTPDGRTVVMVIWEQLHRSSLEMEFQVFSAATGKLLQTFHRVRGGNSESECLQWSNPSGSVLVVAAPVTGTKTNVFGVLRDGRFTPLRGAPPTFAQLQSLVF